MTDIADIPMQLLLRGETREVRLGEAMGAHPTLVVFLRHADCPFCELHVGRILGRRDEIGRVVLVSFDTDQGSRLLESYPDLPPEVLLLGDERRAAYRSIGAGRARWTRGGLRPSMLPTLLGAAARGARLPRAGVDARQLGADVVVAPNGEVTWRRLSDHIADRPSIDEVLAAMHGARTDHALRAA